jgi:N-acetylmuramoyl-L-alanine amidase
MRRAWVLILLAAAGCSRGPRIDYELPSKSQGSRVEYVILHFTNENWESSIKILTEGRVSSHYLVRDNPVEIARLVDEDRRAFHAGLSSWKGASMLNAASIGIEIVNRGDYKAADGSVYPDYPKDQIDAVIDLVKSIVQRHGVRPDRILGHSDIAPLRKVDPGPKFPWKRLADEGLIPWPDPAAVAAKRLKHQAALPEVAWFQAKLAEHGFAPPRTGILDADTRRILTAFQMKYRPSNYDGTPDAETAALLEVLTERPTK